jgi:hypothetical protein
MRTNLLIVAIVTMSGCAGTVDARRAAQRSGGPPNTIPVVTEQPSLSDRLRYSRQREAEQVGMAMTEIRGAVKE